MRIYVGYHPLYRMFGLFRDLVVDFKGKHHLCRSELQHSFGCSLSSCVYGGFCKNCKYVLKDMYSL